MCKYTLILNNIYVIYIYTYIINKYHQLFIDIVKSERCQSRIQHQLPDQVPSSKTALVRLVQCRCPHLKPVDWTRAKVG